MIWSDELVKVRRLLRDPNGNIWSEPFLRHLWNDVQNDMQHRTSVLEDVAAQRVPDLYHMSYMHDWEWRHLPPGFTEFYQCLRKHDDTVFCHSWEPQQVAGILSDTAEDGAHFTQPWEAFMGLMPGDEVRMKFPKNFHTVKLLAYDEEPIFPTTRKDVQSRDSSYLKTEGRPISYYLHESQDKTYVLYPRPSVAFADEIEGEGVAFFIGGDSENQDTGTIAVRTGSSESGSIGASVDVVGLVDNVLLVYGVRPADLVTDESESDFPPFLTKYIRFGVVSRAYDANTDGRIPSLARWWSARYEVGVRMIKRYMKNRLRDRNYRLTTRPTASRTRRRLPRLPDTYPAV